MKSLFRKTLAVLLAAVTLLSLSGNALALGTPAAERKESAAPPAWLSALLPGAEKNAESVRAALEALARDYVLFLQAEALKLQTMKPEELNAYLDTIRESVSSGNFAKLEALSEYVKRVLSEQDADGKTGLDALAELLRRAREASGVSVPEGVELSEKDRSAVLLSTWLGLKLAWLTAAQLARLAGYTCSAALVDYAVLGQNYVELSGRFFRKILKTKTYQNFLAEVKSGKRQLDRGYVLSHELKENQDLFFSLHSCTYTVSKVGLRYVTTVTDLFDFDLYQQNDNPFVSLVNSWGWLSANIGVLREISVNIVF